VSRSESTAARSGNRTERDRQSTDLEAANPPFMSEAPLTKQGPAGEQLESEIIRRAAERVQAAWGSRPERTAAYLAELLDEVERVLAGEEPGLNFEDTELPHLHHRILEALRREILGWWEDEGSLFEDAGASDVLHALSALEKVRLALWPEGGEDLRSRLSEPDAYELLVEVAHDLRSPLSSILFLAETLRSGHSGPVNGLQTSQLGLIYSAALGIVTMCSDVVDLARSRAAYGEDEPGPFSVGELFGQIHETVRPMAEEKGVTLEFLPPENDRFEGYPVLLTRVLLNLVTNALKFTDDGLVSVRAEEVGRELIEFSVEDSTTSKVSSTPSRNHPAGADTSSRGAAWVSRSRAVLSRPWTPISGWRVAPGWGPGSSSGSSFRLPPPSDLGSTRGPPHVALRELTPLPSLRIVWYPPNIRGPLPASRPPREPAKTHVPKA